jgi:hypothetical protein
MRQAAQGEQYKTLRSCVRTTVSQTDCPMRVRTLSHSRPNAPYKKAEKRRKKK